MTICRYLGEWKYVSKKFLAVFDECENDIDVMDNDDTVWKSWKECLNFEWNFSHHFIYEKTSLVICKTLVFFNDVIIPVGLARTDANFNAWP